MKFLVILFLMLCTQYSYSQYTKTVLKAVTVQAKQELYLGKILALSKGKNKNSIKVDLPANTIGWYYSFGTDYKERKEKEYELEKLRLKAEAEKNNNDAENANKPSFLETALSLTDQLTEKIKDTDLTAKAAMIAIDYLTKPAGNMPVDVCLTDYSGYQEFHQIQWTNFENYIPEGSRKGLTAGVIAIKSAYEGPLYLNFRNLNKSEDVTIYIEITAMVAEEVYVDEWSTKSVNQVHEICLKDFANVDSKVQSVCNCITEKLTDRYKPKYFADLSPDRRQQVFNVIKEECYQSTGNTDIANKEVRIKELTKEIQGLEFTKEYVQLVEKYDEIIGLGVANSESYNGAGWYCLLTKQFERAKGYLTKGLGENRNNPYLHGNLANYYMLTGQFEAAKEIHLKLKKHKFSKKRAWKDAVAEDLNLFESLDIYLENFNDIRKVLGIPKGRFAETFDPRYEAKGTMSFQKGKESFVGVVKALDKDKGNVKIDYLNIYGEPNLITKKVTDIIPLTAAEYEQKLANWKLEIQKYKYTVGQYATWVQQKELQFGTITKLDDKPHKASIEYLDIYGEKKTKEVPYLEVTIIDTNDYQTKLDAWNVEVSKYKFSVGEMVSWSGKGSVMVEGEVVGLDDKTHQAEVKFMNEKEEEKVVKKGYLKLVKN
jgi:hypothetical protein